MIDSSLVEPTMQSQTPSSTLNTQIEDPVVITMPQTSSSLQPSFGTTASLLPNTTETTNLGHADITATIQTAAHPISSSLPISTREMNFFRLSFLIFRRGLIAVRTFFDSKHPPLDLISDLALNKTKLLAIKGRVISTQQWNILYPSSGYVRSRQFDVTTLILLLRYMTNVPAPVTGYGKLPSQSDKSVGADLARMKYYRNIVAHSKNAKISEMEFNDYWANIENAIGRLGGNEQLLEARTLKTLQFELKDNEILLKMRQLIFQQNDTIPRNIKEQISGKLELWRLEDTKFCETRASKEVLNLIRTEKCVSVVGNSGTGKSAILHHVALLLQNIGFHVVPIKMPHELLQYFDDSTCQLFIIEDPCGTKCIDIYLAKEWKRYDSDIQQCISRNRKTRILVSCRLSHSKTHYYKALQLFKGKEVDLNSENYSMTIKEKKEIYKRHTNTEFLFKEYLLDLHDCFPLLCRLISTNKQFKENPERFLKFPYKEYEEELDALRQHETPYEYSALILCVMFDNEVRPEYFIKGIDQNIDKIFDVVFAECLLDQGTSRKRIKQAFEIMTNSFVLKKDDCYELLHTILIEILACHFAKQSLDTLITFAPLWILESRLILPENALPSKWDSNTVIKLDDQFKCVFVERIAKELKQNNIPNILFCHLFPNYKLEAMLFHNLKSRGELSAFLGSNFSVKCAEISLKEELVGTIHTEFHSVFRLVENLIELNDAEAVFYTFMKFSGMIDSFSPLELGIKDHYRRVEMKGCENTDDLFREWSTRSHTADMFYERITARQLLAAAETGFLHWLIGAGWIDFFKMTLDYVDKTVIDELYSSRYSTFILSLLSGNLRMVSFCANLFHSDFKTNSFCFLCKQEYAADLHVENLCPLQGLTFIIVPCLKGNTEVLQYLFQEGICNHHDLNKYVDLGM
ncbi:uncharacterized protein LOC134269304 [Saccostrea cucullata]|uniref:uncharacterized protein LOC134269304 n=1 Tax=Saccostrea cuccullata TaxID=36930 RepID=UPI002ED3F5FB